jgi:hypothetical protein
MKVIKVPLLVAGVLFFPIHLLIMLPIELPLWREYRKQNYNVPGFLKFFWDRCCSLKEVNYKKFKS